MCGIIGVFKQEGEANAELYEGLLMLQHRGQVCLGCDGLVGGGGGPWPSLGYLDLLVPVGL